MLIDAIDEGTVEIEQEGGFIERHGYSGDAENHSLIMSGRM
jgi:hypothetical protein